MPDGRDLTPWNHLRVDLYRRLLPKIQEEDQAEGAHGSVFHWDDPDSEWDALQNFSDLDAVWDKIGLSPVIQELFFVVEAMAGEEMAIVEGMDTLTDPLRCPVAVLPHLAAGLGYQLEESLTEQQQRQAVYGLVTAIKSRGTKIGFTVFYRLLGFSVKVFPLWKKDVNEANEDYSRARYATAAITDAPIGPAGSSTYAVRLADVPIKPGSARVHIGARTFRDDGEGRILGTDGSGTINYVEGDVVLVLETPAASNVTISFFKITEEWPYHAARIDVEIRLSPMGTEVPLVDDAITHGILRRMEETRPIHVLLRALALVIEIKDVFGADGHSGATDEAAPTNTALDHRDGEPFPGTPGRDFWYFADQGPDAEDFLAVETISGGVTLREQVIEDRCGIVALADSLAITEIPTVGTPTTVFW